MSKKQLENRLDHLFTGLDQSVQPVADEARTEANVWRWETDTAGIYTQCSSDAAALLGLPISLFIGRSIFNFGLDSASEEKVRHAFESKEFPVEVRVEFLAPGNAAKLVILTIEKNASQSGIYSGYSGTGRVVEGNLSASWNIKSRPRPVLPAEKNPPAAFSENVVKRAVTKELGKTHELPSIPIKKDQAPFTGTRVRLTHDGSVLSIDLNIPEEGLKGLEFVDQNERRVWSEEDRMLVEEVARQLAQDIENARLYELAQKEA